MSVNYDEILDKYPLPKAIKDELKAELEKLGVNKTKAKKIAERCYQAYLANLMEPGEAAGIVAAQSIGEPGTQMSLPYEERIIVKEGEMVKPVEIGKFVDEAVKKYGFIRIGNSEVCDLPEEVLVLSLDQDEKIRWKKVVSCIRHKAPKKLIRIRTRSGRQITATPYHSFVIRSNNKIVPVRGSELRVGDRIPVVKSMPANCIEVIDVSQHVHGNYIVSNEEIKPKGRSKALPREFELDFDFGYFIGVYLAEGYATKYYVSISNVNEELLENVRRFASKFGLSIAEYDNYSGFARGHDVRIYSSLLSDFVKQFGRTSKEKKLPEFVFNAKTEFVRGLLQGYFDGDGNINAERKMIRVYSSSKELIDGIALLLARFGIFSVKRKMKKQYGLVISYRYAELFAEEVGSSIPEKIEKLRKLKSSTSTAYDAVDMIPSIGSAFLHAAKKLGYPIMYAKKFTRKQKVGRATLRRHLENMEKLAKQRGIAVEELAVL
ncbi:MAG: intein-containing DNA-directed RNA polymerase subunit A'', partial [Archaeoglobales archaeon]